MCAVWAEKHRQRHLGGLDYTGTAIWPALISSGAYERELEEASMLSFGITYSLCWFVALVYPTYASYHAIGTASTVDDTQWLTYWVVYSFLSSLEIVIQTFFNWLPLYYEAKLLFVLWLILPQTKGAQLIFDTYIRPLMIKYSRNLDPAFASAERVMFSQQTAMIVQLAQTHGVEIAKLAVQRACEEAPRLAAKANSGAGSEFPAVPTHQPSRQQQSGNYQQQQQRPAPPGYTQSAGQYQPMSSYASRGHY